MEDGRWIQEVENDDRRITCLHGNTVYTASVGLKSPFNRRYVAVNERWISGRRVDD